MAMSGVRRDVFLRGENQDYINHWLDNHLLIDGDTQVVILNNNGKQYVDVTIVLQGAQHVTEAQEHFLEEDVVIIIDQDVQFPLHLSIWDAVVVMLK